EVADNPLDPAGTARDHVTGAPVAVGDGLLEEGTEQVVDIRLGRDDATVDEELRRRLGHTTSAKRCRPGAGLAHGTECPTGSTRGRGYHGRVLLVADIGNRNLTIGLVGDGAQTGSRAATTPPPATPDEVEGPPQ